MLLLMTLAAALIVGAIATLATGSWWLLPLALVVHAAGTIVVVGYIVRLTNVTERPDPRRSRCWKRRASATRSSTSQTSSMSSPNRATPTTTTGSGPAKPMTSPVTPPPNSSRR